MFFVVIIIVAVTAAVDSDWRRGCTLIIPIFHYDDRVALTHYLYAVDGLYNYTFQLRPPWHFPLSSRFNGTVCNGCPGSFYQAQDTNTGYLAISYLVPGACSGMRNEAGTYSRHWHWLVAFVVMTVVYTSLSNRIHGK